MGKSWISYGRTADIIELTAREFSGTKIETFKIKSGDDKGLIRIMRILKEKYNFSPNITVKKSIDMDRDRDMEWLKNDDTF